MSSWKGCYSLSLISKTYRIGRENQPFKLSLISTLVPCHTASRHKPTHTQDKTLGVFKPSKYAVISLIRLKVSKYVKQTNS